MIDAETRKRFLAELEKTGNVGVSCKRSGISRSSYYRWCNEDKSFRKKASAAVANGRADGNDMVEHALLRKATVDGDLGAMKYYLSHNDPRYKQRKQTANVVIEHRTAGKQTQAGKPFDITKFVEEAQAIIGNNPEYKDYALVPVPTMKAMAMRAHQILNRDDEGEATNENTAAELPTEFGKPK